MSEAKTSNKETSPRVEVQTFGCRVNAFESEVMRQNAQEAGQDNLFIFNTCAVTKEAERQAKQAIRRTARNHPEAKIVVTGCAAQIDPNSFAQIKGVTRVLGNMEKLDPKQWQERDDAPTIAVNNIMQVRELAPQLIASFSQQTRAFIQVQQGCDHRCTFCIIPFGRGNARSATVAEVVKQVRTLVDHGTKEVVLTGVDVTSYGQDLPNQPSLGQLIRRILDAVPELPRLRLSSLDSIEADKHLFWLIENEERFMPHLHLSLQAGDNLILKRMKRRHLREDAIAFCDQVRAARPDVVFGADIIAGFPTENENHFQQSLDLVERCGLSFLHVFPYSARKGTPAARMPQVPVALRKERAARLRELAQQQQKRLFDQHVNQSAKVLIEANGQGYSEHYLPIKLDEKLLKKTQVGDILPLRLKEHNGQVFTQVEPLA